MADVFLSYTEKDRETVRRLADTLQSVGWSVWWDRRIPAGLTWRSVLDDELSSMRCMVVLWSANSVRSEWVCEEAAEGRRLGRLVPVSMDGVRPPAGFREVQTADLVGWDGSRNFVGLQRLIEDIERLIGKPDTPASAAPKPVPSQEASGTAPAHRQPAAAEPELPVHRQQPADPLPVRREFRKLAPWIGAALLASVVAGTYFGVGQTHRSDNPAVAGDAPPTGATAYPPVATAPPVAVEKTTEPATSTALGPASPASTSPARVLAAKPVDLQKRPASKSTALPATVSTRCAALRERLELGEQLSSESQSFLNQECRP